MVYPNTYGTGVITDKYNNFDLKELYNEKKEIILNRM